MGTDSVWGRPLVGEGFCERSPLREAGVFLEGNGAGRWPGPRGLGVRRPPCPIAKFRPASLEALRAGGSGWC